MLRRAGLGPALLAGVVAAGLLFAWLSFAGAARAAAAPIEPSSDPFYTYSGNPGLVAAGTVLRTRTVAIAVGADPTPIEATQLLYRTVGEQGQPTVTVTTVIRPVDAVVTHIVSWQMFYDALGSECDPSYTLQGGNASYGDGSEELALFAPYLAAGDTVVVPDYEGEDLEWGAGRESGEDTLDSIRAAESYLKAPQATTPVAMVGYSGGSIATEWAAELAPKYAPQLDLVGAAAGGVPVDFAHNLDYINGSADWSGVIPAVLVGVSRAYHIDLSQYLSAYGEKVIAQVSGGCINSFLGNYPGLKIQDLLKPQYQDFLANPLFASIINQLIMSTGGTPKGPLLLGVGNADGTGDGVMVAADVQELAHIYCQRGVTVEFNVYKNDDHDEAAVPFEAQAEAFVASRLSGLPVVDQCSSIPAGDSLAPLAVQTAAATTTTTVAATTTTATSTRGTGGSSAAAGGSLAGTGVPVGRWILLGGGLVLDGAVLAAAARSRFSRRR